VKKELEEMRAFRAQLQQYLQRTNVAAQVAPPAPFVPGVETGAPDKNSRDPIALSSYIFPGSTKFMLTGYGAAGFEARQHSDAVFGAQFNPIFLWKISDRLLFEGELSLELEDGETSTKLEVANAPNLIKGGEDLSQIGALDCDNFGNNGGSVPLVGSSFLQKLERVFRYDMLNHPTAAVG
jgi:hypothetical protein